MIVNSWRDNASAFASPRVFLLDAFQVEIRGQARLVPPSSQRVVARLALVNHVCRSTIAGQLWPEIDEERAQNCLRTALWRLGRICPGLVRTRGTVLSLTPDVAVDVQELVTWAHSVFKADGNDLSAVPRVACCGELLPGWCDEWVIIERSYVRQLQVQALESAAGHFVAAGQLGFALEAALAARRADPLRESARRVLVQVHMAEGNPIQALHEYREFRDLLLDELGVEPTDEMKRLVRHFLQVAPRSEVYPRG